MTEGGFLVFMGILLLLVVIVVVIAVVSSVAGAAAETGHSTMRGERPSVPRRAG